MSFINYDMIIEKAQGLGKGAIVILILAAFAYYYMQKEKKKAFNIDVGIHKKVGDGTVYMSSTAKQVIDDKGVARFESVDNQIDLPAIDSRYFILSGKGAGRRYIDLYNPLPNVYLPYDKQNVLIFDKPFKHSDSKECLFCNWVREQKEKGTKLSFDSKEFKKHIKDHKGDANKKGVIDMKIPICNNHLSQYYTTKFKVVSEVSKEWLFTRMKERLLRAITQRSWYDKPVVVAGLMIAGGLGFVFLVMKFGPEWFEKAMEIAAKNAAQSYVDIVNQELHNVTAPRIQ